MKYKIIASHANEPISLPDSNKAYSFTPRMQFKQAVKEYASQYNIVNLQFNRIDKSAIGYLGNKAIRISWTLVYN